MTCKSHRLSTCHRHPTKPVTGFCASCLRERLAGIESTTTTTATEESRPAKELRRTKSFSGTGDSPSGTVPEPRRRSCEVRSRSALCDLFNLDDEKKVPNRKFEIDLRNLGFEIREEEEEERGNGDDAIRVCGDGFVCDGRDEVDEETKTMKEFIDLELQSRKNGGRDLRDIAVSFWDAASVVSKRLRKWRRKQKLKKQSEVGEYGLGRRSCDTDPRLSIDDSRFSLDAHRASWDGYLIGRACSRFSPMVHVPHGIDNSNSVLVEEKVDLKSVGEPCPGGSAQTKDYYSDSMSWQRRRRSFDRSNSHRKPAMTEVDELKMISNAKVSPATTELFYGAKVLITDKDLKSSNNVQSDCVMGSASMDASDVATGVVDQKGLKKFHKLRKVWNKLGLVQRRREDKLGGEQEYALGDMANKPIAESWQKLRRAVNGQASESVSQKLIRSYSVSCRHPCRMAGLINGFGGPETKGNGLNGRQEFMLQRNRSVRYSPNNVDTGLLRFYLTPLKSYRRSKSGKSSLKDLNPTARSVL